MSLVCYAGRRVDSLDKDGEKGAENRSTRLPSGPRPSDPPPKRSASFNRKHIDLDGTTFEPSKPQRMGKAPDDLHGASGVGPPALDLDQVAGLERKWHVVFEVRLLQASISSTNEMADNIAAKWGVGTGRNFRLLSGIATAEDLWLGKKDL